jgi:hypothetical protein
MPPPPVCWRLHLPSHHCLWSSTLTGCAAPLRRFSVPLPSPLLPLPFPAPSLAGCCFVHHCSSTLLLHAACSTLTNLSFPHSIIGWLLCIAPLLLLFASTAACFPLATFAVPHSVAGWLLPSVPLLLLFAFAAACLPFATFAFSCSNVVGWLLCHVCSTSSLHLHTSPLQHLLITAPSLVSCCITHHCSFSLLPLPLASPSLPLSFPADCWLVVALHAAVSPLYF